MTEPGRFITFEGPEGSGKTTHARRLADRLRAAGRETLSVREPGGTPAGEAIRRILQHDGAGDRLHPVAELLLFAASRAQLAREVIRPALADGKWVVCDRFADSTTVYQGHARGIGIEKAIEINALAVDGLTPDLTLLMDLDAGEGMRRMAERNRRRGAAADRIERESLEFHAAVRAGYMMLARRWPERFRIVAADRDLEAVAAEVWQRIQDAFPEAI